VSAGCRSCSPGLAAERGLDSTLIVISCCPENYSWNLRSTQRDELKDSRSAVSWVALAGRIREAMWPSGPDHQAGGLVCAIGAVEGAVGIVQQPRLARH
jgi:hypothetical protein